MTLLQQAPMKVSLIRAECDLQTPPISSRALYEARGYLPIEEYEEDDIARHKSYKWWKLTTPIQLRVEVPDDTPY